MRVGYERWSLSTAPGWHARYDPECITITPSANTAALQLSSSVKTDGIVADAEMQKLAGRQPDLMGSPSAVTFGQFRGLSVSYTEDDIYWHRFWLAHGNILIFATYNGSIECRASHEPAVLSMLESLQPEHADA